jgi:hypothetical protein
MKKEANYGQTRVKNERARHQLSDGGLSVAPPGIEPGLS